MESEHRHQRPGRSTSLPRLVKTGVGRGKRAGYSRALLAIHLTSCLSRKPGAANLLAQGGAAEPAGASKSVTSRDHGRGLSENSPSPAADGSGAISAASEQFGAGTRQEIFYTCWGWTPDWRSRLSCHSEGKNGKLAGKVLKKVTQMEKMLEKYMSW